MIWVLRATLSADLWLKKNPPSPWVSAGFDDSQAGKDIQFQELPAWDAFDRHVLRFTGYFKAGMSDVDLWFVWYKWTNAYENARSRWWRPTWKTIVPWEGEISVERFFFVVFVFFWRRGKQGEKSRHFLKKYFVLLGGMLVSYHQGVRKVTIYYYLEDDTCQIQEPKMDNSGMPQGALWV